MWLVAHNRCWTADRLAKRGLAHLEKFTLCDQEGETINHLLLSCVFVRLTRFEILQGFGLQVLAPKLEDSFEDWWHKVNDKVSGQVQKGLNSLIILMAW